ncbi:MAG: HAD family hydrolase [Clostridia bacterium]|nr:HAD family hydrolase [Clostridia bacterium]
MKKQYILFDLDGTLTDPALGITNSLIYALEKFGMQVGSREELYKFIGPPLVDMMMQEYGFSEEKAQQGLAYYREYFSVKGLFENEVYSGIPKLLADLQKSGYKLVLATSKPEKYAKQILEHFDLAKYFYFIGGSDMAETRSTKEAVIEYDLAALGNPEPQSCIMVGDRKYDVIGSAEYGIACVGVLFGYGSRKELEDANAAYIAETVADLGKILMDI